ncbi:GPR1/FUN34/yaaH [Akanthomyces lecanii RCEF 1005]|uniref:GPR1/FUN34/yaaH n=1 Tax=Akanthomyces lecanii RCEF 1005 TaxID=1081108 RepID=A0A169YI91_CORDF|nr:GPR1/FUN34/yaaH [Akanthomyces lecanii RCEF 1005]
MSAESRRHLTNRRTRFRSSTNNERGTVADDELDVAAARHMYPATRPAADISTTAATDKLKEATQLRPAGFVGLGFTMLFLGLHQCLCTSPRHHRRGRSQVLLFLTACSAAAQLIAGVRDGPRDGTFGVVFHGAHSVVWMTAAALLQLLAPPHPQLGADERKPHAGGGGRTTLSVAASMLLMAAAFACLGCAVAARRARTPVLLLLASVGLGLLCLSRAAFQMPGADDAAGAAEDMNRYGGGFLLVSSFLAFRTALHAGRRRRLECTRVLAGGGGEPS